MSGPTISTDTSEIRSWKSILTLVVFVVTNLVVLFPFNLPIYIPRPFWNVFLKALAVLRITSPRNSQDQDQDQRDCNRYFKRLHLPLNFVTAPLIADLFLLAIRAIGGKEVHDGIIGANGIAPYDIMLFFLSLAYIAISVDASGLIRWLALKVLQWGGDVGERLFFYLYAFFFALAAFCGNDPVILSGTAFLAYMTRVSVNIKLPTAWIYTQFAVANIASAILVSSNPTNLVLAGAFDIKFIHYTANMIVPVVVTAIVLFPFLLFIIFQDRSLVPYGKIEIHQLLQEPKDRAKAINPNIPHVNDAEDAGEKPSEETKKIRLLEEIFNPFLDKGGAAFGAIVMAVTLIVLLVVNATTPANSKAVPVFYITLPAALVMFCWDLGFGWKNRKETRRISRVAQQKSEEARAAREAKLAAEEGRAHPFSLEVIEPEKDAGPSGSSSRPPQSPVVGADRKDSLPSSTAVSVLDATQPAVEIPIEGEAEKTREASPTAHKRTTLESLVKDGHTWCQETFPSCTAVLAHLPYALVPFAFSMFVLVQALVTKGWVPVFAYGWDHWTNKTGTIGAIGGMGFLSVILCNFAGTNIGTTILLSRVIQTWQQIHKDNHTPISDRTMWGTIYAMALGVNYGAFSLAFSAALAGLLWRDILAKKHIPVRAIDFARTNLPIIAISMTIGCVVLIGEVYIVRGNAPYES